MNLFRPLLRVNAFDLTHPPEKALAIMDFSVESLEPPALTKAQLADMLFEQIPAYLEFFGLPTTTPDYLRAVARLSY